MKDSRISEVVEPVLAAHGLELDDLEVIPAGRRSVLRITVDGDGPRGRGPKLDEIAVATRAISEALDDIDAMQGAYTLEVSSRGTAKPLSEVKHYRRNLQRLVKLNLADGSQLVGRLTAVEGDQITVQVTPESVKGNRNPKPVDHQIGLSEVVKAVVQVELNRSLDDDLDDLDLESDGEDSDGSDDELDEDFGDEDCGDEQSDEFSQADDDNTEGQVR